MKTIKQILEVYKPKSPDEQKFVDKHVTIKHKDRNGNGDDVFKATNVKTVKRSEDGHGYDVGEDEKVYEEVDLAFFEDLLEMNLDEDTFTDASIANLRVMKHKQMMNNIENSKKHPLMKVRLMSNAKKKLAELEKARDHYVAKHEKATSKKKKVAEEVEDLEEKYIVHVKKNGKPAGTIRINAMDQENAEYHAKNMIGKKPYRGYELHKVVKEEVEDLDELSKKTLGNYVNKAATDMYYKGQDTQYHANKANKAGGVFAKQSREKHRGEEERVHRKASNRSTGVERAVDRLTKEDIINRAIDNYMPEDYTPPSLEDQFLARIEHLPEAHAVTLFALFDSLNEENQYTMIESADTEEGVNALLDFAINNRGE